MFGAQGATPNEREQLRRLVDQWNENRLDLFSLSYPSEDLEIHGVMRFYFQESRDKVSTKCIRVSSTATTRAVIEALVDKFHPDLKMLSNPEYSIWEVHENGDERRLAAEEKPLLVQLNWHKDDREGRFLLRRQLPSSPFTTLQVHDEGESLKRGQKRFSKREKKELKKKHQRAAETEPEDVAKQLYKAVPPTTFTRTISNPEIVMKKRRERKLATKLKEMGHGGSLKIYGYDLVPSRPYVTLLVSVHDRASKIIKETLEKYGLEKENARNYVLVEITLPTSTKLSRSLSDLQALEDGDRERFVDDDECPLVSLANRAGKETGEIMFAVRRRPSNAPRPRLGSLSAAASSMGYADPRRLHRDPLPVSSLYLQRASSPFLVPLFGENERLNGKPIMISPSVMEIGSDSSMNICLSGQFVKPRHAVITFTDGVVTITPSVSNADLEVDGQRVMQTVILRNGSRIRIGYEHLFQYFMSQSMAKTSISNGGRDSSLSQPLSSLLPNVQVEEANMETTFGVDGSVSAFSGFLRRKFAPIYSSSTDLRKFATRKGGMQKSKVYRSTGDLVDEGTAQSDGRSTSWLTSDKINTMLSSRDHLHETAPNVSQPTYRGQSSILPRNTLPAILDVPDSAENEFIRRVLGHESEAIQFRLAPALMFYMLARYRISPYYHSTLTEEQRRQRLRSLFMKVAERCRVIAKDQGLSKESHAFWLANTSELLNTLKQDTELCAATSDAPQEIIVDCVESHFELLCAALKDRLRITLNSFINTRLDDRSSCSETVVALEDAMRLLRRCRLNAALTIQLFSQLFHFINAHLFNWLVSPSGSPYCSTAFGVRLRTRLGIIHDWAEQQGLELAAECHMDRIRQAVALLTTPKTVDQIANLGATCYKLNSIQVRWLLEHMVLDVGEEMIGEDLIESVVRLAETQADEMASQDGTSVQLEEQPVLQLPFLLPQDGYSTDLLRGVPPSMTDYISSLQSQGLCRMLPQPGSSGSWTVHFHEEPISDSVRGSMQTAKMDLPGTIRVESPYSEHHNSLYAPHLSSSMRNMRPEPALTHPTPVSASQERGAEIVQISFHRGTGGIGLSIVAAQGIGESAVGIYVKKVVDGSAAHRDGRLQTGDQLLSVNGQSLIGISQEDAAAKMNAAGPTVSFEVNKQAARYNGLSDWLTNPPSALNQLQQTVGVEQPSTMHSPGPMTTYGRCQPQNYSSDADHHCYLRQDSVSSTAPYSQGGFERSDWRLNGPSVPHYTASSRPPLQYGYSLQDLQLRNSRSTSASELYRLQNASSSNSLASFPPRAVGFQPVSSVHHYNTSSGGQHNLPTRYRTGAPSRPIVIQPGRTVASPNPLQRVPAPSPSQPQNAVAPPPASHVLHPRVSSVPPDSQRQQSDQSSSLGARQTSPYTALSQQRKVPAYHTSDATDKSNVSSAISMRDELKEKLDRLEMKGAMMTEADRHEYRQLVNKLSKIREPLSHASSRPSVKQPSESQRTDAAIASTQSKSHLQHSQQLPLVSEKESRNSTKETGLQKLHQETSNGQNVSSLIDDAQKQMSNLSVQASSALEPRSRGVASPTQEAVEDPQKKKKGVQWNDEVSEDKEEPKSKLLFNDGEAPEPRVQVLGAQEVYRDPRQRRLNEIQAKQNASQPTVDGANLGFRDKMKLFAEQLGERTPKARFKASSAQREIEQSIEP